MLVKNRHQETMEVTELWCILLAAGHFNCVKASLVLIILPTHWVFKAFPRMSICQNTRMMFMLLISGGHLHLERMPIIFHALGRPSGSIVVEAGKTKHSSFCYWHHARLQEGSHKRETTVGLQPENELDEWVACSVGQLKMRSGACRVQHSAHSAGSTGACGNSEPHAPNSFALSPSFWNRSFAESHWLTSATKFSQPEIENSHKNDNKNKMFLPLSGVSSLSSSKRDFELCFVSFYMN